MEDAYIKYSGRGKNKQASIHITNECTVYNVETIYSYLKTNIKGLSVKEVIVENVSNIDLAGAQMLVAFKRLLTEKNNNIKFQLNINDDITKILTNCGFNNI